MISLGFVVKGEICNNSSHLCSGLFHFERLVLDRWRLKYTRRLNVPPYPVLMNKLLAPRFRRLHN
jgi:hypothetical protein